MTDHEFWYETPPRRLLALIETRSRGREKAGREEVHVPTPDEMIAAYQRGQGHKD